MHATTPCAAERLLSEPSLCLPAAGGPWAVRVPMPALSAPHLACEDAAIHLGAGEATVVREDTWYGQENGRRSTSHRTSTQ